MRRGDLAREHFGIRGADELRRPTERAIIARDQYLGDQRDHLAVAHCVAQRLREPIPDQTLRLCHERIEGIGLAERGVGG